MLSPAKKSGFWKKPPGQKLWAHQICGILKNKHFFGILNAIFIIGSRYFQNAIFGRVVAVNIVSGLENQDFEKNHLIRNYGRTKCAVFL